MRYNAKVEYSPGKALVISDALSRSPINQPAKSMTVTDVGRQEKALLQSTVVYALTGWPRYEKNVAQSVKEFLNIKNLLSVSNRLLTYTDRIVGPTKLKPDMLNKIQAGYQGITNYIYGRCKSLCRVVRNNAQY